MGREDHERFVSGSGCHPMEALGVLGFVTLSVLNQVAFFRLSELMNIKTPACKNTLGLMLVVTPTLAALWSPQMIREITGLCVTSFLLMCAIGWYQAGTSCGWRLLELSRNEPGPHLEGERKRKRKFVPLSYSRSVLILITVFCILAVDFPIFPRMLAKTERSGFSLMDFGVGMFICHAAATSVFSRGSRPKKRGALIMGLLGALRTIFVIATSYQSPVTEYGVHLNFLICFALTTLLCELIYSFIPGELDGAIGSLVYIVYQLCLQYPPIDEYLHSPERGDMISANKEGLASVVGSTSLFLVTSFVFRRFIRRVRTSVRDWVVSIAVLLIFAVSCMAMSLAMHENSVPVSRRLFSLSYGMWILAIFCMMIAVSTFFRILYLYSSISKFSDVDLEHLDIEVDAPDSMLKAVNDRALYVFLVANVLTGLVNMTLGGSITSTSKEASALYLMGYMWLVSRVWNVGSSKG